MCRIGFGIRPLPVRPGKRTSSGRPREVRFVNFRRRPGGRHVGPRQRCRTVTTTVERDDGRMVTRRERRCD